jgi:hypothetical protein
MALSPYSSLSAGLSTPPRPGTGISAAGQALGFGGDLLSQQVKDETDEERKRRMQQQQFSPAGQALLGLGAY